MSISFSLIEGWKQLLRLCKVQAHESVLLLAGTNSSVSHLNAARVALSSTEAQWATVHVDDYPQQKDRLGKQGLGPTAVGSNRTVLGAMKLADVVIDLLGMYRGEEQHEVLASGTRVILVKESPETFLRMLPTELDKQRVLSAKEELQRSRTMRVTSPHGTDFSVELGEFPVLTQYGFADEPGRWDHCPSTFVATWPNELSSNGRIVLMPGDIVLPMKFYVSTPITLTVEKGFITEIAGEAHARDLREYMQSFRDPEGYAVAHLGWGLSSRANWSALASMDKSQTVGMDARSFEGNFMFSTGQNADIGGPRRTACHLDIPMRDCSILLEQGRVVSEGKLIGAAA